MTARQNRTPLGAMYRTPLGAFGPGAAAAPADWWGEVAGITENVIATPIADPCGIQVSPQGTDTVVAILLFSITGDRVSWADYIVNFSGKLYQGQQSGLQARFGGVYQSADTFCEVPGSSTTWVPGLTADIAAGYRISPDREEFAITGPNPGWIVGERVDLLE